MEGVGENKWKSFSTDSGNITLKNCPRDYFHLLQSLDLGCRFLNMLVLIRGFLLYFSNQVGPGVIKSSVLADGSSCVAAVAHGNFYSEV